MFEQEKHRLIREFEDDKERIYKDVQTQKSNYDATKEKLKNESMDLLHQVKSEFKEKLKQKEIKHQVHYLFFISFFYYIVLYVSSMQF